jgi:hypothetical protein
MKAFPTEHPIAGMMDLKADGMDLRDYFAAKAMQAILFDIKAIQVSMDKTANLAYQFADAMMKARNNDS